MLDVLVGVRQRREPGLELGSRRVDAALEEAAREARVRLDVALPGLVVVDRRAAVEEGRDEALSRDDRDAVVELGEAFGQARGRGGEVS